MSFRRALPDAFRPLIRLLPRGAGTAINLLAGSDQQQWLDHPRRYRTFFDRSIGASVKVDLAEWFGRLHYFGGRYYDLDIPHVIRTQLKPGDTFIDIGAHYGMHTLCASQIVGVGGRVISFEPNPHSFARLTEHVTMNHLANVTLHNLGLSDHQDTLTLSWSDTVTASFLDGASGNQSATVRVARSDEMIANQDLPGRCLIKIDTEGFEHQVIKGLPRVLERDNVMLIVEITDEWLKRAGSSAKDLVDDLKSRGFSPHLVETHFAWTGAKVQVEPIQTLPDKWQYDLLFVRS